MVFQEQVASQSWTDCQAFWALLMVLAKRSIPITIAHICRFKNLNNHFNVNELLYNF